VGRYCLLRGWLPGAPWNRPARDRRRERVCAAELDRVLLTAADRLTRHYVHPKVWLEERERGGCEVQCLDHPLGRDPPDPRRRQIRGAVAA
jgi:site-specific DNA recombinase